MSILLTTKENNSLWSLFTPSDGMDYIALAVPFFFLFIGLELIVMKILKRSDLYRVNDSINDLSCGVLDQIVDAFCKATIFTVYIYLFTNFRIYTVDKSSVIAWILLFLGVDCCYYWFHRCSHIMNAPWAAHIVHHQSEEFNLSVALRQGAFQSFFSWIFYLPLAIFGFHPLMFGLIVAINTLYQFWIHTRLIGKLGPLEWIFNTPSHHRVHHGRDIKYLDKNFAGTLIIWDRMFGTFYEEEEEPVYGVLRPLNSWNPLWANFQHWATTLERAKQATHWWDKIRIWFMPPSWLPEGAKDPGPFPPITREIKFDPSAPKGLGVYLFVQFIPVLLGATIFLNNFKSFHWLESVGITLLLLLSLANIGGLFEKKNWAIFLEWPRLLAVGAVIVAAGYQNGLLLQVGISTAVIVLIFMLWFACFRPQFKTA